MITYVKNRERGERNSWGKLPMTNEVEAILRRQVGYHRMQVWTYIARGKKGGKGGTRHGGIYDEGARSPITYTNR